MTSSLYDQGEEYPSMLWVAVPSVILVSAYFIRKWYLGYRLRRYGIGKGAPGFQTNVRRIRVTPDIAARLQRGEEVSPEEIAASSAKLDEEEARLKREEGERIKQASNALAEKLTRQQTPQPPPSEPINEWLPETISGTKKRGKGKKR